MSRLIKGETWLDAYRRYTSKQESPEDFHFWIGLTMLSAALRRRVYIDRGAYKVYPNQYILLLAESASCRKSVAMGLGLRLIETLKEIRSVHERCTVEGLIDLMESGNVYESEIKPGRIMYDGSALIHADELSNLFSKATYITDLVSFLTAAYTSSATLGFLTRNKAYKIVRAPCPTLLAGTTPEQLGEIFPLMSLSSGFMGRLILVRGKRGRREPRPIIEMDLIRPLIEDLRHITKLEGEVVLTEDCENYYDKWYRSLDEPTNVESAPFFERKHDHTLKLAMLLSISESDEMIITKKHLDLAISVIDQIELNIPHAVRMVGATEESKTLDLVYRIILRNMPEGIGHSVLLRKVQRRIHYSSDLQDILDRLSNSKRIRADTIPGRKGLYYWTTGHLEGGDEFGV